MTAPDARPRPTLAGVAMAPYGVVELADEPLFRIVHINPMAERLLGGAKPGAPLSVVAPELAAQVAYHRLSSDASFEVEVTGGRVRATQRRTGMVGPGLPRLDRRGRRPAAPGDRHHRPRDPRPRRGALRHRRDHGLGARQGRRRAVRAADGVGRPAGPAARQHHRRPAHRRPDPARHPPPRPAGRRPAGGDRGGRRRPLRRTRSPSRTTAASAPTRCAWSRCSPTC